MNNKFLHLQKNDSDDIGFVHACLFHQAITLAELRLWAEHVITTVDDYPDYIFDLMNYDQALFKITNTIGFVPNWQCSIEEEYALYGIAYKRGIEIYECPISRERANSALMTNIHIENRFREMFPFIDFSAVRQNGNV